MPTIRRVGGPPRYWENLSLRGLVSLEVEH